MGNNLVVFYYLTSSNILPDKRGGLWWKWPSKMEKYIFKLA